MHRRLGRGAAIGLATSAALIGFLILLPSALQGSFYEVSDSLLVLGIPLLVIGTTIGAMTGASSRRALSPTPSSASPPGSSLFVFGTAAALVICLLAVMLFLSGAGIIRLH